MSKNLIFGSPNGCAHRNPNLSHLQTKRRGKCHITQAQVFLLSLVSLALYADMFNWTVLGKRRDFMVDNPFCP